MQANCRNATTDLPQLSLHQYMFPYDMGRLIQITYLTVATVGIIFNLLLCFLILRNRNLRSIVNYLIINLAVGSIVACLNVYPMMYLDISSTGVHDHTADLLCGLTSGMSVFFIGGSVAMQTLTVLSMSRYLIVHRPHCFPWRLNQRNLKYAITSIWICAVLLVVPNIISFHYNKEEKFCLKQWAVGVKKVSYLVAVAVFMVALPVTSLFITYCTTVRTLRSCNKADKEQQLSQARITLRNQHSGVSVTSSNARLAGTRNSTAMTSARVQRHVVRLLGMLIVVYVVCWMPFVVYWFLSTCNRYFRTAHVQMCHEELVWELQMGTTVKLVALCSTVLYPVAYFCTNTPIRHTLSANVAAFLSGKWSCTCVDSISTIHLKRKNTFL